MSSLLGLESYDSDSGEEESASPPPPPPAPAPIIDAARKQEYTAHLKPLKRSQPLGGGSLVVCANPTVEIAEAVSDLVPIAPDAKEVMYNPKYDELFTPVVGPDNPLKTQQAKADKNTLAGTGIFGSWHHDVRSLNDSDSLR